MHIGIDTGSGKWSESYYDLLSSEARLTSYFAVARGDVPREHWRALSRAQVQKDHYRGCVSWSGSMFEYLMPELFLPPVRDSLLWESAKFCLYVQRRRVRPGQAWGVSESAYFALDSALSYRYKAHGCAALALQPGMDRELVLSPYSSLSRAGGRSRARRCATCADSRRSGCWGSTGFSGRARLHPRAHGRRRADRALRDGAPPGHEPAGGVQRAVRRSGAAVVSRRPRHARAREHCCPNGCRWARRRCGGVAETAGRKGAPPRPAGLRGRGHGRRRRSPALRAALQRHVLPRRDRRPGRASRAGTR